MNSPRLITTFFLLLSLLTSASHLESYAQGQSWSGGQTLTGTYRLNRAQSDDARSIAERLPRSLPENVRQAFLNPQIAPLSLPDVIALQIEGRALTIASSEGRQTLAGDEHQTFHDQNLGPARLDTALSSTRYVLSVRGTEGSEISISLFSLSDGNLRLTFRLNHNQFIQPFTLQIAYDRISDVAQLDSLSAPQNTDANNQSAATTRYGSSAIPLQAQSGNNMNGIGQGGQTATQTGEYGNSARADRGALQSTEVEEPDAIDSADSEPEDVQDVATAGAGAAEDNDKAAARELYELFTKTYTSNPTLALELGKEYMAKYSTLDWEEQHDQKTKFISNWVQNYRQPVAKPTGQPVATSPTQPVAAEPGPHQAPIVLSFLLAVLFLVFLAAALTKNRARIAWGSASAIALVASLSILFASRPTSLPLESGVSSTGAAPGNYTAPSSSGYGSGGSKYDSDPGWSSSTYTGKEYQRTSPGYDPEAPLLPRHKGDMEPVYNEVQRLKGRYGMTDEEAVEKILRDAGEIR